MLRTNLATRPFYNERAIRAGIALVVLVVAALSAFNALQVASLNRENNEFRAREQAATRVAQDFRQKAEIIRQSLNKQELAAVQAAAREANQLIDRRAFSWTDLFNKFEETLPADVRIAAVQPQIDEDGRMLVAINVIYRRAEDVEQFSDRLEGTGAFQHVLSRADETMDDGTLRSVLQGYYDPISAAAKKASNAGGETTPPPPAADSAQEQKGNVTPNASAPGPPPTKSPTGAPR